VMPATTQIAATKPKRSAIALSPVRSPMAVTNS
jgi:hypothetical protein